MIRGRPVVGELACWQSTRAGTRWARAACSGSGSGPAGSVWGWVPESSTDFIFAILGEELGLVGTLSVVLLYGGIAYAGIRIARRMHRHVHAAGRGRGDGLDRDPGAD